MASAQQEVKTLGMRVRTTLRVALYVVAVVLFAFVVDQIIWFGPITQHKLTASRFKSHCAAVKPGMDPGAVIDLMNSVATQQYFEPRQMEFDHLHMRGGTRCVVEFDDKTKVKTVTTGNLDNWLQ